MKTFRFDSRQGVPADGDAELHYHPGGDFSKQEQWLPLPTGRITGLVLKVDQADPHYHHTVVLRISHSNYGVVRHELPKLCKETHFDFARDIEIVVGQMVSAKLRRGDLGTVSKIRSPFSTIILELKFEPSVVPVVLGGWDDDPFDLSRFGVAL